MTHMSEFPDPYWGLPDPALHGEFYADVPVKRLVAWIVDTVVVGLLTVLVLPFTAFAGLFFLPILFGLVSFGYRTVTLARGSSTWGMRLVALEMRNARGERFDTTTAAMHTLIYTVGFAFVVPQVASVVLMLTGARAQGLGDHLLGTAAINRPSRT